MSDLETRKKIEYQWDTYLDSGGKSLSSSELTLLRQQAKKAMAQKPENQE